MSELERILKLAGSQATVEETPSPAPEATQREMKPVAQEAVGPSAEAFYEMQDMYAGGECPSKPHETIIDELVRYLSGDQVADFVETFRRHHMDLGDDMFKDDVNTDDMDEAMLNASDYKCKDCGDTMHNPTTDCEHDCHDETGDWWRDKDGNGVPDSLEEAPNEGNEFSGELAKAKAAGKKEFEVDGKKYKVESEEADTDAEELEEEVEETEELEEVAVVEDDKEELEESPTMDTTQLVNMMKNAGLSEEAINEKLNEWANTPDGAAEEEATEHGEPYENFAQSVNLSLKRYLDAESMKVGIKEHTVEDLKEAYKAKKEQ